MRRDREGSENIRVGERRDVDIKSVKVWKGNMHDDTNVNNIRKAIRKHGQQCPIYVWRKNNTIYKGNTTYEACRLEGFRRIAVIYQDYKSETEAQEIAIEDNNLCEKVGWDMPAYLKLLKSEHLKHSDASSLGLTSKEFTSLMSSAVVSEDLPDVDIRGNTGNISQMLVIQFDSEQEQRWFKEEKLGIKMAKQRVIEFNFLAEKLGIERMSWKRNRREAR